MTLSIIIVNYNVKYFLEQCLCSVQKAIAHENIRGEGALAGQVEVWVVDNNSADGSVSYLQERFPFVKFLANGENVGFARANNQALFQSLGKYILFLNPDTILPEHCFQECIGFMDENDRAGALGVQMIDGTGKFLPESKRGFPSPWVSFCKMTGLTRLFPQSRLFGKYYLAFLPRNATHKVDVLSGAFIWVRKEVLDRIGGFDERFFMYAEDIDLSYRIQLAGYENYYLPNPIIIHFKGESTRRDAHYVRLFYTAMIQFVDKYYKGWAAKGYKFLLNIVIFLKSFYRSKGQSFKQSTGVDHTGISLFGDKTSIPEMEKLIPHGKETAPTIATCLYCEGPGFGFATIISKMANSQSSSIILVHGAGTSGAVGSDSRNRQGLVVGPDQN